MKEVIDEIIQNAMNDLLIIVWRLSFIHMRMFMFKFYTQARNKNCGYIKFEIDNSRKELFFMREEMLVCYVNLLHYKHIIFGSKVMIYIHNRNNTFGIKTVNNRIMRWMWIIKEISANLKFIKKTTMPRMPLPDIRLFVFSFKKLISKKR